MPRGPGAMALYTPVPRRQGTVQGATEHCRPVTGATEHISTVAFANIGLLNSALEGKQRNKHMERISRQSQEILQRHDVLGICFCEAGEQGVGFSPACRKFFEKYVTEAFEKAGATEHGEPQYFWEAEAHYVSVFKADVDVEQGKLIRNLYRHQPWRDAQTLKISTGDMPKPVRVINSQQPSSDKRPFTVRARMDVLTKLFQICASEQDTIGALIGGDLNCSRTVISETLNTERCWRLGQTHDAGFMFSTPQAAENQ